MSRNVAYLICLTCLIAFVAYWLSASTSAVSTYGVVPGEPYYNSAWQQPMSPPAHHERPVIKFRGASIEVWGTLEEPFAGFIRSDQIEVGKWLTFSAGRQISEWDSLFGSGVRMADSERLFAYEVDGHEVWVLVGEEGNIEEFQLRAPVETEVFGFADNRRQDSTDRE